MSRLLSVLPVSPAPKLQLSTRHLPPWTSSHTLALPHFECAVTSTCKLFLPWRCQLQTPIDIVKPYLLVEVASSLQLFQTILPLGTNGIIPPSLLCKRDQRVITVGRDGQCLCLSLVCDFHRAGRLIPLCPQCWGQGLVPTFMTDVAALLTPVSFLTFFK